MQNLDTSVSSQQQQKKIHHKKKMYPENITPTDVTLFHLQPIPTQ